MSKDDSIPSKEPTLCAAQENAKKLIHDEDRTVYKAKLEIQKQYSSIRNALGVRLIGLIAGLFTLLQIVQNSQTFKLSKIFPDLAILNIDYTMFGINAITSFKLGLFFAAVWILLFFIIRTFFKFSVCSYYSDHVHWVTKHDLLSLPDEWGLNEIENIHSLVLETTGIKMAGKLKENSKREYLYHVIPYDIFIADAPWGNQKWGYILCAVLSFLATAVLIFIMW